LTKKEDVVNKLKKNYSKVTQDLDNQREIKKKLEETVSEQTKQYNELVRNFR
jgi:hypothetical protein